VCKLWGAAKYFHPYLAYRDDIDWDAALVSAIPKVNAANSALAKVAAIKKKYRKRAAFSLICAPKRLCHKKKAGCPLPLLGVKSPQCYRQHPLLLRENVRACIWALRHRQSLSAAIRQEQMEAAHRSRAGCRGQNLT
jgi:hypothetical protein